MGHEHPVLDADPHFKIDKETRSIKDQSQTPSILMQGDHNSERYTFEMPRYIDGHDMSLCDLVEIHYVNTGSASRAENRGVYIVTDLQLSEERPEETVLFTWLISRAVTMNAGSLSFLIRFACTEDDQVLYAWNTAINKEKSIGMSIYNTESIQEERPDLIAHIENAIKGKVDSKGRTANKFLGTDELGNVIDKDVNYSEIQNTPKIPTKISELQNDSELISSLNADEKINIHNESSAAHADMFGEIKAEKADAIVSSASGEQIVLADSDNEPFKGLHVYGKSTQVTTTGAQLFDKTVCTSGSITNDGVINRNGEVGEKDNIISGYIQCNEKENYTSSQNVYKWFFYNEEKQFIKSETKKMSATAPDMANYFVLFYSKSITDALESIDNIMVNIGASSLPFEPYTGGKPSPSIEYPQEITNYGDKGSINVNVDNNGYIQKGTYFESIHPLPLVKGCTYHIECKKIKTDDINCFVFNESDKSFRTSANLYDYGYGSKQLKVVNHTGVVDKECRMPMQYSKGYTFKVTVDGLYLYQGVNVGTKNTDEFYIGHHANIADEEYEKQTLTLSTPNGLSGIPVTTNGNYTDANGQQWVCDEIDLARGKYVQRVKKSLIALKKESYGNPDGYRYTYIWITDEHENYTEVLSDKFRYNADAGNYFGDISISGIRRMSSRYNTLVAFEKSDLPPELIETTVYYILATPIERDLTPEEIAAYKALHTNYPTTVITNDENAGMEVSYVADIKNYITEYTKPLQEQITALQQALVNLKISGGGYNGLTVDNSSDLKVKNLRLFGKSTQVVYKGINLLDPNKDGAEFIAYPAKAGTYFTLMTNGVPSEGGNILFKGEDDSEVWFAIDKGHFRVCQKIAKDVSGFYIQLQKAVGLKYMFAEGDVKEYEPYTGGKPSPSIEYPQEIVIPGSKGLLNVNLSNEDSTDTQTFTIPTPNGLPGVTVYTGGNYTDETGQQWGTDEIDFVRRKYLQRINRGIFDGSTDEKWEIGVQPNGLPYAYIDLGSKSKSRYDTNILCNRSRPIAWSNGAVCFINEFRYFSFYNKVIPSTVFESSDNFKAWLAEHPLEIIYEFNPPIEHDLAPEVIEAFEKLHTYYPATTVTTDEDVNLELEYTADTKNYIDTKIAEVSTAIVKGI